MCSDLMLLFLISSVKLNILVIQFKLVDSGFNFSNHFATGSGICQKLIKLVSGGLRMVS